VAIALNNSQAKFTFLNGKSDVLDLKGGQAMWLDSVSHPVENTGTEDVTAVLKPLNLIGLHAMEIRYRNHKLF